MNTIFVQIASYRDPELPKTLKSILDNADHPDNLHICICLQYCRQDSFNDDLKPYFNHPNIKIIGVDYIHSKGACWARNKIQQYYNNETYTLQIDSHHRFIKGWDTKLINMYIQLQSSGYKKPLITAYPPNYDPITEYRSNSIDMIVFDHFSKEGVVLTRPEPIPDLSKPAPARFFAGGFSFTTGMMCIEVQHNPDYYFYGEEISIAARAYTYGYDLFHPNEIILWHEYTRKGKSKHWDDDKEWYLKNNQSLLLNQKLFGIGMEREEFHQYGFGTERTLEDYENYIGIKFNTKQVSEECFKGLIPNKNNTNYTYHIKSKIEFNRYHLPSNYEFICLTLLNEDRQQIYRKDYYERYTEQIIQFNINTQIEEQPIYYVIWGYNNGWVGQPIEGRLMFD